MPLPQQTEIPVGSSADLNELEYLSALQQTEKDFLRSDATLIAKDIRLYLKSRHGLDVLEDRVAREILQDLGGTILAEEYSSEPSKSLLESDQHVLGSGRLSNKNNNNNNIFADQKDEGAQQEQADEENRSSDCLEPSKQEKKSNLDLDDDDDDMKMAVGDGTKTSSATRKEDSFPDKSDEFDFDRLPLDEQKQIFENVPKFDIAQVVSLLLIPIFCRLAHETKVKDASSNSMGEEDEEEEGDLIDAVLHIMLQESRLEYNIELTKPILIRLLNAHGEGSDVPEKVIDQMLLQARFGVDKDETIRLNRQCLLRALTADISDYYNVEWPGRETTFYEDARTSDVLVDHNRQRKAGLINVDREMGLIPTGVKDKSSEEEKKDTATPRRLKRIYTAANIDSATDNYMR